MSIMMFEATLCLSARRSRLIDRKGDLEPVYYDATPFNISSKVKIGLADGELRGSWGSASPKQTSPEHGDRQETLHEVHSEIRVSRFDSGKPAFVLRVSTPRAPANI